MKIEKRSHEREPRRSAENSPNREKSSPRTPENVAIKTRPRPNIFKELQEILISPCSD